MFQSRVKGIDGAYKLSELLSGRGSADTVVNVATLEFRFRVNTVHFVYLLFT